MRTFFLLSFVVLFSAACGKKIAGGADGRDGLTTTSKAARVIKGLEDGAFSTQYLEGKARLEVQSRDLNIGGTAVIRLEKDRAIWMSVKKFGFEGARALIRPDSFFVVNRLNGDYTAEPLSYLEQKYKIPARFELLQEIVLGNAVFFSRDLTLATEGERYRLTGKDTRFATEHVVDGRGFHLLEMHLTELGQNRKLSIQNADFQSVAAPGGQSDFAHGRTVVIDAEATGRAQLDLTFTSLEFTGPLAMPFTRK